MAYNRVLVYSSSNKTTSGGLGDFLFGGGLAKTLGLDSDAFNPIWKLGRTAFDSIAAGFGVDAAGLRNKLSAGGVDADEYAAELQAYLIANGYGGKEVPAETLQTASDVAVKEAQAMPQTQVVMIVVAGLVALYLFGGKL